jgi:hypothetical protein
MFFMVHRLAVATPDFPVHSRHTHDYQDTIMAFTHSILCGHKTMFRFGVSQFLGWIDQKVPVSVSKKRRGRAKSNSLHSLYYPGSLCLAKMISCPEENPLTF